MPTLQEEYDVLAGELRGLNVRLDLPEDDGIPQAQPIGAEYDALARELRGLNARLGLPENDGISQASPANSEYENLVQQNNALDQRLSALFPTFDEWNAEQDELDKRSNWEATKTFADNFITGAGALAEEGAKAVKEVATSKAGWDSLGGIWEVGKRDFVRFAKTMGGAAEDWLPTTESERSREYRRAKENFDYYQTVRPLMVDAVGGDAKNLVSFGAQFVDPLIVIPVPGTAAKAGAVGLKSARLGRAAAALDKVGEVVSLPSKAVAKATRKGLKGTAYVAGKGAGLVGAAGGGVAKLAALPRTLASKVAQKVLPESAAGGAGGALLTGQLVGAATGAVPFAAQLGIGEIAGFIANRTGKGIEKILTTLAAPGAQQRFLQRLAQTAESPRMRRLALIAHRKGLTKAGDVAFNSLVNGASIASINGALAYLSGESAEGIGQAAGAGMVMGGVMPFGQPGQKAGKAQSSRDATSINYLEGKLASEQVKEFRKLEPEARLVAATAEEAGIPIPKLFFVDSKMFLDLMRQDDPNAREAQSAMYDPKDKTIYVNQDISSKSSSRAVMQMFTEELGHHFITEAIKTDPMFGHQILAEYKAKPGEKSHTFIFERDPDGNPLRTIEINEKGKKLADAYSSISDDVNVGIGNNANTLAQEIGAAQFSIMMDENPNLFPHLAQPIRHKLVNASQKILSLMGITDKFGNTLPLNIASKLKRSPAIRNLYRNYLKQREMHMAGKIDLAEKGQSIPLKRGESPEAGAERLFGATGLSLKDAKSFVINNKQIKNELTKLKNRYQDEPADGWSVPRNKAGNPLGKLIGKELTPDMRVIFTRTNPDPRGSVNIAINDIQAAIADNGEVNFLYRSGKPSKYSDNELKIRVVAPVGFEISGMAGKGTAGLYMQGMDIAYLKNNVEVLVQEGFIKDPDKFIDKARQVAKEANAAGSEGRINPEGKFENELITVALGNKASADFIKNLKLARLLEEGRLQHSFRMYHIGSLAGIALTGRPGIGFDWLNVKRNYSPHGRNFMPRRKPNQPDDTIPLPFPELPGDIPGEGFGRMINVDKTKSEMAEAKRLADEAQDGFSSSGNVRSKDAYGRDKLFMPAAEAGAPKGKEKWSAELWRKKGTDSPFFRRWFGRSKTLEYQGTGGKTPLPWIHYGSLGHGGPDSRIPSGEIWVSQPQLSEWTAPHGYPERGQGAGRGMTQLYVRANKIWDWRNDAHLNALTDQITAHNKKVDFKGRWSAENYKKEVRKSEGSASTLKETEHYIKELGFDAAQIGRNGELVIFDAAKNVKSADNRGTFSPAEGNILFMPAESKGQPKKILLRTKQEISDAVDSLAAERGISRNDALNELLNSALLDPKRPEGKRSEGDITLALTPEEIALLEKTEIGPEESAEYKAAIAKRRAISEREIGVKNRLYMPAISPEQRRASKYGKGFSEAVKTDKEFLKKARADWMDKGFASPLFQQWMAESGEPAFARVREDGIVEPIKLFYAGKLGVGKAERNVAKIGQRGKVTRRGEYVPEIPVKLLENRDAAKAAQGEKKPLEVATNVAHVFDPDNPGHVSAYRDSISHWLDSLAMWMEGQVGFEADLAAARRLRAELSSFADPVAMHEALETVLGDMIAERPEAVSAELPADVRAVEAGARADMENFRLKLMDEVPTFAGRLEALGWQGLKTGKGEITIFDPRRVKLIVDQAGEYAFFTKNRPFGTVAGTFGADMPSKRFSGYGDTGDLRFMPAAKPESVSPNTVQSWDGDPSFPGKYTRGQAKGNDDVGKLFQEKYVEKYGEPIDPYDYTPETTGWLGGMLYDEAKVALARAGNAVDWYTKAVAKAMTIAEEIFPEIKTSAAAKDRFLGALAITSQNMRVLDNARAAVHQYDYKQKHGVFDYKKKHGGKAKMITENLRMFDKLEAGLPDFHTFLDQDFTVKELTEFGQKFFGKEKFAIEGRMNDQVKGSAVFGPKIGQGFFQNLKGNYLPVTIDLWLRRTFGRLTGRSVSVKLTPNDIGRLIYSHRHNKGKRKAKNFELPEFLQGLKITGGFAKDGKMNFKITESAFERVFGEHEQGMANAEAVFDLTKELAKDWSREYSTTDRAVAKLKAELAKRKKAGQPVKQTAARLEKAEAAKAKLLEEKPLWAFASTSISGKLKPIDIPTPQERTVIVDAFNVALKKLKDEGYNLTPADLQATLWYPEKDIWAFLKGDKAESLNLSYDQAMEIIRDERR